MTSDTVTTLRISTLVIKLEVAAMRVAQILAEAENGKINQAESAQKIREIMEELNRAAS